MSLPVIAYVLQPDQVIFTPTTENGPLPGIYAASDFIAKWRDWDAGTAGRPARAWHTLYDAVLKAGDRFDFFLRDEALKAYGEELFSDPQERLEWCIRTAIGLERWDEAKRLINELEGYALPPIGFGASAAGGFQQSRSPSACRVGLCPNSGGNGGRHSGADAR